VSVITGEGLLTDRGYVHLIRWVFTARLVCLALAAPAALGTLTEAPVATIALLELTLSRVAFSRSDSLIRTLIRHPLLASVDTGVSIVLLLSLPSGQPVALTVVCSALAAGLLFPGRTLVLLMVPLVLGSLGAPATVLADAPASWQGWLALLAGLPALVLGIGVIGSVVRRYVSAMITARQEVSDAIAAIGAADERARIARDMHDSVGKSIHGIALGAKALRRVVDSDPPQARELANAIAGAADQAAQEARTLLVSLRSGQDDRPTVDVITEILADWGAATGIDARLTAVEAVDAGPEVTHQLAYALREILRNVEQHARAERVSVGLDADPDRIALTVSDDGIGFELERAAARERQGHFGLRGLRERAEQVGGEVEITSRKREGTTVRWTAQTTRDSSWRAVDA
jgi:signal transduction histidine kinase